MADNGKDAQEKSHELRRRAEETFAERHKAAKGEAAREPERDSLLHELQVHQIELEIQNENLRQAQTALEVAKERYFALYDLAPVGYVTLDRHGIITEANLTFSALVGTDRSRVKGTRLSRYLAPEDADACYTFMKSLLDAGEPQSLEARLVKSDGSHTWMKMDGRVPPDTAGERKLIYITMVDITDRKRAEEALRLSEERYRGFFENAVLGIYQTTPDGRILAANPATVRMMGYDTFEDLARQNLEEEGFEPRYPRSLFKERVEADGQVTGLESAWKRRDGSTLWVRENARAVRDETGRTLLYEGTVEDITDLKQAQEALRESEAILNETGFIARIGGWEHDLITGRATWTKALYDIDELESGPPPGPNEHLDQYPPRDRAILAEAYRRAVETGEPFDLELQVYTAKRHLIWSRVIGRPIMQDGKCIRMAGTFQDTTKRKEAEEVLRQSEEKYRTLFENMAQGAFFQRADGTVTEGNPATLEMFGLTREEFLDRTSRNPLWKVIHEDGSDFSGDQHPSMQALQTGKPIRNVVAGVFNPRKKGYVWLSINAIPQFREGEDTPYQVFVTLHDITERRQAEAALRESEERLALAASGTRIGMYEGNIATGEILGTEQVARLLGLRTTTTTTFSQRYQYHDWRERVYPEDLPLLEAELQRRAGDGAISEVEYRVVWPDGSTHWIADRGVFQYGADGRPTRRLGVVMDITERKKAEQRLVEYQGRLRELATELTLAEERERRRLVMWLHDEISQRLALLKLSLQSLNASVRGPAMRQPMEKICGEIEGIIADAHSLTFELSNPVLYEAGFANAVESWLAEYVHDRHGLAYTFQSDDLRGSIDAEVSVALFRSVRELLANVIKHAKSTRVDVRVRGVGDRVEVTIRDDGVGFEPSRVGHGDSQAGGYGLFSIQERLECLGGGIDIESAPGRGTRVSIAAPMRSRRKLRGKETLR
ncbi:MAG: PAS domain S-box protein [Sedimentisphaerales bacterium]|nr:PAS domain S-box protein [Sedimentisphaerales bacterium]